jgi:hypothetical protein
MECFKWSRILNILIYVIHILGRTNPKDYTSIMNFYWGKPQFYHEHQNHLSYDWGVEKYRTWTHNKFQCLDVFVSNQHVTTSLEHSVLDHVTTSLEHSVLDCIYIYIYGMIYIYIYI